MDHKPSFNPTEFKRLQAQLLADINVGIKQANQGLARPLDVTKLILRGSRRLAKLLPNGEDTAMASSDYLGKLGPPSIRIAGFSLWIHGREHSEANDSWGNWLTATAHCGGQGASVTVFGAFLETNDLATFANECEQLHLTMSGEASLAPLEPEIHVTLKWADRLGRIDVTIDISPNQLTQSHQFRFEINQSLLPELVSSCRATLDKFPVIQ